MKTYTVRVFNSDDKIMSMWTFSTTLNNEDNLKRVKYDIDLAHGTNYKNFTLIEEVLIAYEKPCQTADNLVQKGLSNPNL